MGIFDSKTEEEKIREKEVEKVLGKDVNSKEVQPILEEFNLVNNSKSVEDIYEKIKIEGLNGNISSNELLNTLKAKIKLAMDSFNNPEVEMMKKEANKYGSSAYELANPPKLDLLNKQVELLRKDLKKNNELQEEILKLLKEK